VSHRHWRTKLKTGSNAQTKLDNAVGFSSRT
jgi:hypothetical protein